MISNFSHNLVLNRSSVFLFEGAAVHSRRTGFK